MSEPLCRWCSKTLEQHVEWRGPGEPVPRTPCLLLRSGFSARESKPAGLAIFGKPMVLSETHPGLHNTCVGPFELIVMPAVGMNKGRWWWSIETRPKFADVVSDYVETPEAGARAIEKALTDIETAIRQARTA